MAAVDSIPSLLRTIGELEREGVSGLFGLFIEPDPGNPRHIVTVRGLGYKFEQ